MDPEDIMLSVISQTEKDKYCMISSICGIKKKKKTPNQINKTKQSPDSQIQRTDWWLPEERDVAGEAKWGKGIKRYKLPGTK